MSRDLGRLPGVLADVVVVGKRRGSSDDVCLRRAMVLLERVASLKCPALREGLFCTSLGTGSLSPWQARTSFVPLSLQGGALGALSVLAHR